MYSRASSRRSMIPPNYSGVLFEDAEDQPVPEEQSEGELAAEEVVEPAISEQNENQTKESPIKSRGNVRLPLPAPKLRGLSDCLPRYPLIKNRKSGPSQSQNKKSYSIKNNKDAHENGLSVNAQHIFTDLLQNLGTDGLLIAALILMMLECGADKITVLLLGSLLI